MYIYPDFHAELVVALMLLMASAAVIWAVSEIWL